jgi:hypothetical protein
MSRGAKWWGRGRTRPRQCVLQWSQTPHPRPLSPGRGEGRRGRKKHQLVRWDELVRGSNRNCSEQRWLVTAERLDLITTC